LIVFSYAVLLPYDQIISSKRIAGDAMANVVSFGGKFVSLSIAISIFGTIGIYTMSAPRIYFAMAKDGIFFNVLNRLHDKYKSPFIAILTQAFWATVLVLFYQNFQKIITFVTFMDIVFMTLATASIFIIRKKYKHTSSVYQTIAYPIVPLIYLIISISFVGFTLYQMNNEALAGLAILLLGIPTYYYFSRKQKI
jgi:APA family basic amino acid/polyamine antiporter